MMKTFLSILIGLTTMSAQLVLAHPGHGAEYGHGHSESLLHSILGIEPVLIVAILVGLYLIVRQGLFSHRNHYDDEE